jgi:predicted RNA-binding Zn-ribbon protein involved in translation (DUF1610 family)
MTDPDKLKMSVVADEEVTAECPRCGEVVPVNSHDCDAEATFDGVCAMCQQPYDEYLEHLKDCDGGE